MTDDNAVPTEEVAQAALDQYQDELMAYANVTGVGIQDRVRPDGVVEPVVQIYVKQKLPPEELNEADMLPKELEVTVKDPAGNAERQTRVGVQVEEMGELGF